MLTICMPMNIRYHLNKIMRSKILKAKDWSMTSASGIHVNWFQNCHNNNNFVSSGKNNSVMSIILMACHLPYKLIISHVWSCSLGQCSNILTLSGCFPIQFSIFCLLYISIIVFFINTYILYNNTILYL